MGGVHMGENNDWMPSHEVTKKDTSENVAGFKGSLVIQITVTACPLLI